MRHSSLIVLSRDHHKGLALALRCRKQALGQLKPMGSAGLRARAGEVLEFYRGNLISHFRAEEKVLFPFMRSSIPESASLIDLLLRQHEELHRTLARLEAGHGLAKLIFDVGDLLEAHIRKEERELFPLFEKNLEQAKTAAVGAEIKKLIET